MTLQLSWGQGKPEISGFATNKSTLTAPACANHITYYPQFKCWKCMTWAQYKTFQKCNMSI